MKQNFVLYGFFGALALMVAGVIFLIVRVTHSVSDNDEISYIDLGDERRIVDSKLDAYNKQLNDSIMTVRNENVKIDIGKLWGDKVEEEAREPKAEELENLVNEVLYSQAAPQKEETKPKRSPKPTPKKTYNAPKSVEPVSDTQPNEKETVYRKKSGFKSSFENTDKGSLSSGIISAVVHSKQTVQSSTVIKFRLTQSVEVDGNLVPEGTFINGRATLSNERVKVDFESIILNGRLIPFKYTVYDPDGLQGIHVPGLIINEAAKDLVSKASSSASTRISVPVVGSVALSTAQKENNKNVAVIPQDYPVFLNPSNSKL